LISRRHARLCAAAALISVLVGVAPAHADQVQFTISGSTQMYTLGQLMAQQYTTVNNQVNISVEPTSGQIGFDSTCSHSVALGMSDNYIQDSQSNEPGCNDMENIPIAVSATVAVYNLPGAYFSAFDPKAAYNPQTKKYSVDHFTRLHPVHLTAAVIAGIYSCQIKMWNDKAIQSLNPGMPLPAQQIHAFSSTEPGGSGFIFNQWLALSVPSWQKAVGITLLPAWPVGCSVGVSSSGAMVTSLENTQYSLGFVGFDFAIQNANGMAVIEAAALKNASGYFVTPSLNGLSQAIGDQLQARKMGQNFRTPFVTVLGKDAFNPACFEFLLVHQNLRATGLPMDRELAVKNFLSWTISDTGGQQYIEAADLRQVGGDLHIGDIPVPPEIRAAAATLVKNIVL